MKKSILHIVIKLIFFLKKLKFYYFYFSLYQELKLIIL